MSIFRCHDNTNKSIIWLMVCVLLVLIFRKGQGVGVQLKMSYFVFSHFVLYSILVVCILTAVKCNVQ